MATFRLLFVKHSPFVAHPHVERVVWQKEVEGSWVRQVGYVGGGGGIGRGEGGAVYEHPGVGGEGYLSLKNINTQKLMIYPDWKLTADKFNSAGVFFFFFGFFFFWGGGGGQALEKMENEIKWYTQVLGNCCNSTLP